MRAMITGAGGQLGRALLTQIPDGWEARGFARSDLDLRESAAIDDAVRAYAPDVLINAAAYTAVDRAESEPDVAHSINAAAVAAMTAAVEKHGGHLVHVSTDFVFDGRSPTPYRPGDARNPLSAYGRTKSAGEDAAGPDATILRTAWVYGAGGANFVNTMLRLMRSAPQVRVVADQIGAPTWVDGLAAVAWGLAARRVAGIFHHSDAGAASWYDFAVAVQEEALALGMLGQAVPVVPITTAEFPTPATRPAFSLLDSTGTRALLGTEAVHWRANLRRMLMAQQNLDANSPHD